MTAFREDGHLSGKALAALAGNEDAFTQLERLEIAEHLAFCDPCLERYTALLDSGGALLVPRRSCQGTLRPRAWAREVRRTVSRCATAAAAVALALTALWSGGTRLELVLPVLPEDAPGISRQLSSFSGELHDSFQEAMTGMTDFFDGFRLRQMIEGGKNP